MDGQDHGDTVSNDPCETISKPIQVVKSGCSRMEIDPNRIVFHWRTRPYTLPLSRGQVGRSGIAIKRSYFVFVMDGRTNRLTDRHGKFYYLGKKFGCTYVWWYIFPLMCSKLMYLIVLVDFVFILTRTKKKNNLQSNAGTTTLVCLSQLRGGGGNIDRFWLF